MVVDVTLAPDARAAGPFQAETAARTSAAQGHGASSRRPVRLAALAAVALLAACGLPRSGPSKNEIFQGAVERGGNTHIIYVNDHVARAASFAPSYGFGSDFTRAGSVGADEIRPGDVLGLTIWENVDDGLLASLGQSNTNLQELQVDRGG